MKRELSPLALSLLIAAVTALLSMVVLLLVLGNTLTVWALVGLQTLAITGVSYLVLQWSVFSRLRSIYGRLLTIREARLPDYPPHVEPDTITGINHTIKELQGTLRDEIQSLKRTELWRQKFIGDVSHELKTPIFATQGFIETLLDGALEDPNVNRAFLKKALKNVFRLSNLVEDLLMVTSLESGEFELNRERVRIHEIVLDVAENLGYKAEQAGVNAEINIISNGHEKTYVHCDEARINQVLTNLVDNAIKYGKVSQEGGYQLAQVRIELQEIEGLIRISVCDNGPGSPEGDLPHIFERFYRVEKSRSRLLGGNGLGLSIVKNLVEAHNQEIEVQSEPGRTCFNFTLAKADGKPARKNGNGNGSR
ncbi:MAG: sensor histidine kinase [Bacteroidota bacterium]